MSGEAKEASRRIDRVQRVLLGILLVVFPVLAGAVVAWRYVLAPGHPLTASDASSPATLPGEDAVAPEAGAPTADASSGSGDATTPAPGSEDVDPVAGGTERGVAPAGTGSLELSPLALARIRKEVLAGIQQWSEDWSTRDADRLLTHYSTAFEPDAGRGRDAWEASLRKDLASSGWIRVAYVDLDVATDGKGTAVATFTETIRREERRQTVVRKELTFRLEEDRWRIVREQTLEKLPSR